MYQKKFNKSTKRQYKNCLFVNINLIISIREPRIRFSSTMQSIRCIGLIVLYHMYHICTMGFRLKIREDLILPLVDCTQDCCDYTTQTAEHKCACKYYYVCNHCYSSLKLLYSIYLILIFHLTLPTAKAGGFLFQPLLHWLIPYGIATSYTVSTSQIILFPYALRCSLIYIYADCICSPLVKIFILALVSLLCMVWHSGHSHTRTARFFTSGFLYPQQEQV